MQKLLTAHCSLIVVIGGQYKTIFWITCDSAAILRAVVVLFLSCLSCFVLFVCSLFVYAHLNAKVMQKCIECVDKTRLNCARTKRQCKIIIAFDLAPSATKATEPKNATARRLHENKHTDVTIIEPGS